MKPKMGLVIVAVLLLMYPFVMVGAAVMVAITSANCDTSANVDVEGAADKTIANFTGVRLTNAALIMQAGAEMGLSVNDQTIAVMTAIGESSLEIKDHGDAAGPDSRGLFQQRDNWGPLADRMDAKKSATLFYQALIKIDENDRKTLPPTIIAHRVQNNLNPYHYEPFWGPAQQIVSGLTTGNAGSQCSTESENGTVGKDGWAAPAAGPVNSSYGMRDGVFHSGVDFNGGGCGGAIWAAYPGTVTYVGVDNLNNGVVYIDHGGKVETRYVHMYVNQIYVKAGQKVKAADHIAAVGSSGMSTGCHLHFEVKEVRGVSDWSGFQDPIPFLAERGITF